MKKTNLVLATVLTTIIGFGSGAAMADDNADGERSWKHQSGKSHGGKHGKRGGKHGGKHMMMRMAKKLDLSDEQKAQMKSLREAQKGSMQELRAEMKALRTKMQELDPTDSNAVDVLAAEKGALAAKMFKARNEARVAFENLLTTEQKEKLVEMKAERKTRMEERKQKRMERRAAKNTDA